MEPVVFHIINESLWANAQEHDGYTPERFDIDGFIHLSKKSQILRPANLLYRGQHDLVLLVIDVNRLVAELIYEPGTHGEAEHFPHLYGPLNVDAVVDVIAFPCEEDGSFELPTAVADGF